jgi:hypothetical protein
MQAVLKAQTHRTRLGCAQPDTAKRAEGVPRMGLTDCDRRIARALRRQRLRVFVDGRPQNQAALRMRYLHRHWPGINPPLLQAAALPAGQLMEQGGEPCAEQKL